MAEKHIFLAIKNEKKMVKKGKKCVGNKSWKILVLLKNLNKLFGEKVADKALICP